jgi:multidrug efflux pump subunit AcrA (membrane-fusion protein)
MGWILAAVFVLGGAGFLYYVQNARRKEAQKAAPVAVMKTAAVTRGAIDLHVRVTGATNARTYYNIVAPRLRSPDSGAMALLKLAGSGSHVKKGDLIAEFDPQSIKDHLDDTIAGYNDKLNDVKKKQVQLELDMENLRQSLLRAKASVEKARLDLKALPVRTAIDMELLKLALDESEATYRELQAEEKLRQEAQKADMRVTEISRVLEEQHVERHREDLSRLTMTAPASGMVVIQTMHRHGGDQVTYSVGDRLSPGALFMRIADRGTMQLEGTVNQAEIGHFRIGQEATIRLDAYPEATYRGRVVAIGALATPPGRSANYYLRSVPILVQILEPDQRVLPDLSASAEVLVDRAEDVLLAPSGAVKQEDGQTFVYVKNGESIEKRVVTIGPAQGAQVALTSGVSEGDMVVIN